MKFFIWKLGIATYILKLVVLKWIDPRPWIKSFGKKRIKEFLLSFIWNLGELEESDKDCEDLRELQDEQIATGIVIADLANEISFILELLSSNMEKPKNMPCTYTVLNETTTNYYCKPTNSEFVSRSQEQEEKHNNKFKIPAKIINLNFDRQNLQWILKHSKTHFLSIPFEIYSILILTHHLNTRSQLTLSENSCVVFQPQINEDKQLSKIPSVKITTLSPKKNTPKNLSPSYSTSFVTSRRTQKRKYSDLDVEDHNIMMGSVKSPFKQLLESSINDTFSKKSPIFQLKLNQCSIKESQTDSSKKLTRQLEDEKENEIQMTCSTPTVIRSYFQQELHQKRSQQRFKSMKSMKDHNNYHRRRISNFGLKQQPTQTMTMKTTTVMSMAIQSRRIARKLSQQQVDENEQGGECEVEDEEKCPPFKTLKMYDPYWTPKHVLHNHWDIVKLKNDWDLLVPSVLEELDKKLKTDETNQDVDISKEITEKQEKGSLDLDFEAEIKTSESDLIHFLVMQRFSLQTKLLARKRLMKKKKERSLLL